MDSAHLARQVGEVRIEAGELCTSLLQFRSSVIPKHHMNNVAILNKVFYYGHKVFVASNKRNFINAFPYLSGVSILCEGPHTICA